MRVVIDTNLWVSFLIGKELAAVLPLLLKGDIRIITSLDQIFEFDDVVLREKFRRYFSIEQAKEMVNVLTATAEFVENAEPVTACRDEGDDYLLALAVSGGADMIVSGDTDLLALNPFRGIEILTPREFAARYDEA